MDGGMELLKKRLKEMSALAERTGRDRYLGFLTPAEAGLAREMTVRGEIKNASFFGGYEDAERLMARFSGGEEEADWPIACVLIRPRSEKFAEDLTHRDLLGALMALGVERDVLGDLRIRDKKCWCFCRREMAGHILSLEEVRRTPVKCGITEDIAGIPPLQLRTERFTAASERIDAVVSEVCGVSRAAASELCRGEKVFLNDCVQTDPSRKLKEGDVFSVRGQGKFRYNGDRGLSKKGRMILEVGRYV